MSWSEFGQQLPFPGHRKSADAGFLIGNYRPESDFPRVNGKVSDATYLPIHLLPAGAITGWISHPLGKRRLCTARAKSGHSGVACEICTPTRFITGCNWQTGALALLSSVQLHG